MSSAVLSGTRPLSRESMLRVPAVRRLGGVASSPRSVAEGRASAAGWCWCLRRRVTGSRRLSRSGVSWIRGPAGWVQLGHGDNDSVVLLAHVVAALERTGPVRGELLEELSRRTPRIDEVVLPLLAADLGERDPFVLVLDDVDVITAKKSRAILAFLVEQVRSGCQLVLVTRGDPGVPLGRLRASGDLVEIGTALLALDAVETRDVAASGGLESSEAVGRGPVRADGGVGCRGGAGDAVAARP